MEEELFYLMTLHTHPQHKQKLQILLLLLACICVCISSFVITYTDLEQKV